MSGCGVPECAESYYEELSFSLNYLDDPTIGCTSGIEVCSQKLEKGNRICFVNLSN